MRTVGRTISQSLQLSHRPRTLVEKYSRDRCGRCGRKFARSNLVRQQQQICLGIRNPRDKSDALQRLIEGLEAFHAEFDNNAPAAVDELPGYRQRFEHRGSMSAVDRHHGDSVNALRFSFWFEPHVGPLSSVP
jgi:hypothetical protein